MMDDDSDWDTMKSYWNISEVAITIYDRESHLKESNQVNQKSNPTNLELNHHQHKSIVEPSHTHNPRLPQ
jgi:hypothetical protein